MEFQFQNKDILLNELKSPPIIYIYDKEEDNLFDPEEETYEKIEYKPMAIIRFQKNDYKKFIYDLLSNFINENKANKYIENLNYAQYVADVKNEFLKLKEVFETVTAFDTDYFFRKDAKIFYHPSGNDEPEIIDINSLKPDTFSFISEMVRFQYETIDRIINAPIKNYATEVNRKYKSTYLFDAFELSPDGKFTNRDIQDVYESLCSSGLVEKDRLKDFIKIFNKACPFKKIKWTGKVNELYFFFKILVNEKILINPKRKLTQIIINSFCTSDGLRFNPAQLNSCHKPKDTRYIDEAVSYFM